MLKEQPLLLRNIIYQYKYKILPNVVDMQKWGRAFLERSDGLFGISRRSSQCGVREEPTERRQSAGQACAFLQLRHFEGQSATSRLPLRHKAVVFLREIKIPIMVKSIYFPVVFLRSSEMSFGIQEERQQSKSRRI